MGEDDNLQVRTRDQTDSPSASRSFLHNRWLQLTAGIIAMVAVSNLQYGWTLFVNPLHEKYGWSKQLIQVAFTIFIVMETWLVPLEVYLADRRGPRLIVIVGGVLAGIAWTINAHADSLTLLYLGNAIGGIGAGMVYGTSIGSALKWFPDHRGLAVGLTAAAWGAGSALTVWPVQYTIQHAGYEAAFLWFGLGQAAVVVLMALILRPAPIRSVPAARKPRVQQASRDYTPLEVVQTPHFWILYVMMTMVTTGGLMAIAQLAPMSHDYGVAEEPVSLFGLQMAALTFALSLDRILNGLTRPFFGWISDQIGRELTMLIAFGLEGVAILLLLKFAHIPVLFVILSGLTFFAWGEAFSLFPALMGDLFGRRYASTNYGMLYTAKGMAALLVPIGSYLFTITGSWEPIFGLSVAFDWTAALTAWFVLRPLRERWMRR